jgi:hypothetical protein
MSDTAVKGHKKCLRGYPVFVIRSVSIVENRMERAKVRGIRTEPGVDVFALDRNYAAIVANCRNFERSVVGDCGKGE